MAASSTRGLPVLPKYDVLEEIGHGGMATVYRAMDKRLQREVAIKVIHPHLRDSAEVGHRFVVEAQAVAKLRHGNIVEVFDVSNEEDPEKYLVVELVRGSTLRQLLKKKTPLPVEVAAAVGLDVLAALAHAHAEGVVHRDVKPENVLIEHRPLRGEGDTPPPSSGDAPSRVRVKLTDFGIAKLLDAQGVTSTGQVLGSPAHMAPEQIEGGAVSARADVFGLGVLLYEAMVGHLPFEGTNPAQVLRRVLDGQYSPADIERPTVGKRFSMILDKALAHDAADRFESAVAMRDALVAELKRVGVDSPARELESYFDDPDGYVKDHDKRTIRKLCDLAAGARKENRSLDAAADYNRALAYAPDDPQLLRIVANMQRDAARARMLRQAAPFALATIVAMPLAYWVTTTLKHRPTPTPVHAEESAKPAASQVASVTPSASVVPSASVAAVVSATTTAVATTAPTSNAKVERIVTLSLTPAAGIKIVMDNDVLRESASTGDKLTLPDEQSHVLVFSCAGDACDPVQKTIPAGKENRELPVELHIRPAVLTLKHIPPNTRVGIDEYPTMGAILPDTPVNITVPSYRYITLIDLAKPTQRMKVDLTPGQRVTTDFQPN